MENRNRWWEFYFVRYAMGTFVGALFAFFITRKLDLTTGVVGYYEGAAYLAMG